MKLSKNFAHLREVLPGNFILSGGQTHDSHLHIGGVAVNLVHGDLLEGGGADDVHRATNRSLVLLIHVRVPKLQDLSRGLEACEAEWETLQNHIFTPHHI